MDADTAPDPAVPGWPPGIPARLQKRLAVFTFYRNGVCRWYAGKMRHICGRKTPLDKIEDAWAAKKADIDSHAVRQHRKRGGQLSLKEAASEFFDYINHRLTSRENPIARATRSDYVQYVNGFGKVVGADKAIADVAQEDFARYARTLIGCAPPTVHRHVAYITAFFNWCVDEGLLAAPPRYGRYFVKPSAQILRDRRMAQKKAYTPAQLALLWKHATHTEKAWIALGLNGALDNADIANLPLPEAGGVLDLDAGLLDYQRRKRGLVRRIIPLRKETVRLIRHYLKRHRSEPATEEAKHLLFLTPTGLPMQRYSKNDNSFDEIAIRWRKLMVRAGLREPYVKRKKSKDGKKHPAQARRQRGSEAGQGFRALRTTFPNLAPRGYRDEIEIVMGHVSGGVLAENYIEQYGLDGLRELVDAVWVHAFPTTSSPEGSAACPTTAAASALPDSAAQTASRGPRPPAARPSPLPARGRGARPGPSRPGPACG
jgi:integrase